MEKNITRIDIERLGHQPTSPLTIRYWYEGWREGDAAHYEEMIENGGRIESLLVEYEKQGFTCEMASNNQGRALRGKITRVDFLKIGPEYHIRKYPFGWSAKTRPIEDKVVAADEWNEAISWVKSNGWTVVVANGNARAFRGPAQPVHDTKTILRLRRQFPHTQYDLAVYGGLL